MDKDDPKPPVRQAQDKQSPTGLLRFWQELKRRKVMRVAGVYAVVAWLIIQVASVSFEGFGIPTWAFRFVMLMVILGFPLAIVLAWAFELTPDGIKTTKVAREEASESPVSAKIQSKRTWVKLGFAAAAPTVIFGALAVFFYLQARTSDHENSMPLVEPEKSIAVLPLTNMSPDPENAFFADGVHEDVLTNLSKVHELLVIGRTSTLQYRDTTKTLKQIGEELGVRYLVEGSVRRASDQVLVTVQLIDSQTGGHLWAENYNRKLYDIFAIQADVAKEIAGQLKTHLTPEEIEGIEQRPTENQEAYDLFTKYRQMIDDVSGRYDEKSALLEKAVALDPQFTQAWAYLAAEYVTWWHSIAKRSDPELLAKAHSALKVAENLEPSSAYVILAKSFVVLREQRDIESAISLLLEALATDPALDNGHFLLGDRYRILGRLAEAQHHFETFALREPLQPKVNRALAFVYGQRRLWDKCLAIVQQQIEQEKNPYAWQKMLVDFTYWKDGDRDIYLKDLKALPGFEENKTLLAWHAIVSRDFETAQEHLKSQRIRLERMSILSRNVTRSLLSFVNSKQFLRAFSRNRVEAHQAILETNADVEPDVFSDLAIYQAFLGEREAVQEAISKTRELTSLPYHKHYRGATSEVKIAIAYLVLGERDKAIETLEGASKMKAPFMLARELDLWFIFDRLRGDPRFDKLLED